jgi:ketopantoate reductase
VFLAVKALSLRSAFQQHQSKWASGSVVIPLCNGYIDDDLHMLESLYSKFIWRRGVTTLAGYFSEPNVVTVTNQSPKLYWGTMRAHGAESRITEIEQCLSDIPGFAFRQDMEPLVVKKWIANVVINSLTAAYSLPRNGLLLDLDLDLRAYVSEAQQLAKELWPDARLPEREQTYLEVVELIKLTADNENSMARDKRKYKNTESAYLAGMAVGRDGYPKLKLIHAALV